MTSRVMLIPNYFARRQTKDTVCTDCCPNKDPKNAARPQKSRTQLHIATYWIFTIQKLVRKQMFICYDLTTVSWLYVLTFYVLFRVLFVYFIFAVLLFTVHLCAIDTRFNKCNSLNPIPSRLHSGRVISSPGRKGNIGIFVGKASRDQGLGFFLYL